MTVQIQNLELKITKKKAEERSPGANCFDVTFEYNDIVKNIPLDFAEDVSEEDIDKSVKVVGQALIARALADRNIHSRENSSDGF